MVPLPLPLLRAVAPTDMGFPMTPLYQFWASHSAFCTRIPLFWD